MTIRIFYAQLLFLLLLACSTSTRENEVPESEAPDSQIKALETEVLAIHDEVMPLMGDLISLKTALETKNQQLKSSGDQSAMDEAILNEMIINSLDQAHEGMMIWMRSYHQVDPSGDVDTGIAYLEQEKSKIDSVRVQVYQAIRAAKESLESSAN